MSGWHFLQMFVSVGLDSKQLRDVLILHGTCSTLPIFLFILKDDFFHDAGLSEWNSCGLLRNNLGMSFLYIRNRTSDELQMQ